LDDGEVINSAVKPVSSFLTIRAVGGYLGGFLFDLSSSYQPAWMLSLVAGIVTAFVAFDLAPPVHPRQRHQSEEEVSTPASLPTSSSPA
jgi:hypothetical protein